MKRILYKIDFVCQKAVTSLLFSIPPLSLLKKLYFILRFQTAHVDVGYDIVVTNFDRANPDSGIVFKGTCILSRHVLIDTCGGVVVGKNVLLSENVNIQTHTHLFEGVSLFADKTQWSPLEIGDEVWICDNVMITEKVKKIGQGAVIAAGSIVTKDVLPYEIVGGVPAKPLKTRLPLPAPSVRL